MSRIFKWMAALMCLSLSLCAQVHAGKKEKIDVVLFLSEGPSMYEKGTMEAMVKQLPYMNEVLEQTGADLQYSLISVNGPPFLVQPFTDARTLQDTWSALIAQNIGLTDSSSLFEAMYMVLDSTSKIQSDKCPLVPDENGQLPTAGLSTCSLQTRPDAKKLFLIITDELPEDGMPRNPLAEKLLKEDVRVVALVDPRPALRSYLVSFIERLKETFGGKSMVASKIGDPFLSVFAVDDQNYIHPPPADLMKDLLEKEGLSRSLQHLLVSKTVKQHLSKQSGDMQGDREAHPELSLANASLDVDALDACPDAPMIVVNLHDFSNYVTDTLQASSSVFSVNTHIKTGSNVPAFTSLVGYFAAPPVDDGVLLDNQQLTPSSNFYVNDTENGDMDESSALALLHRLEGEFVVKKIEQVIVSLLEAKRYYVAARIVSDKIALDDKKSAMESFLDSVADIAVEAIDDSLKQDDMNSLNGALLLLKNTVPLLPSADQQASKFQELDRITAKRIKELGDAVAQHNVTTVRKQARLIARLLREQEHLRDANPQLNDILDKAEQAIASAVESGEGNVFDLLSLHSEVHDLVPTARQAQSKAALVKSIRDGIASAGSNIRREKNELAQKQFGLIQQLLIGSHAEHILPSVNATTSKTAEAVNDKLDIAVAKNDPELIKNMKGVVVASHRLAKTMEDDAVVKAIEANLIRIHGIVTRPSRRRTDRNQEVILAIEDIMDEIHLSHDKYELTPTVVIPTSDGVPQEANTKKVKPSADGKTVMVDAFPWTNTNVKTNTSSWLSSYFESFKHKLGFLLSIQHPNATNAVEHQYSPVVSHTTDKDADSHKTETSQEHHTIAESKESSVPIPDAWATTSRGEAILSETPGNRALVACIATLTSVLMGLEVFLVARKKQLMKAALYSKDHESSISSATSKKDAPAPIDAETSTKSD